MKLRWILLGLLALALMLAACGPAPQLRDDKLLSDTSLVSSEPCGAPCWRGITPGETAWRDAQTILEDATDIENLQTQTAEDSTAVGASWNAKGGSECCQMVAQDGETVNLIYLRTKPEMTLGQVVEAHGEPTYALGTAVADDQAAVYLVYPDIRTIVLAFTAGENATLSEDSEIVGMLYVSPDDMDLFLKTQYLFSWKGYGPFSQYKQADGASYEVTPSVTLTPTPAQ